MSSWGNYENAANVPLWAASTVNLAPTLANTTSLLNNTTANTFVTGQTIGIFGVDSNESVTNHATQTGWVKRIIGSGGRAGRITQEVLVALSNVLSDSEDATYKDTLITITTQPVNGSAVSGTGNTITYSVVASGTGSAPLNYYWQFNNGSVWANTATSATLFPSGNTSATLTANAATTTSNTYKVRVIVNATGATGAAAVTSANATISIS